ncbi:glycosyltransferase [Halobium salinum]|uniref:Glycosyltransferase n=1 Tax=Halobium salinum TaxID=1364940 RepID=A0ABD5P7L1_9EURY|nr:glycosyltransferase family 2 protein [Halobium salinum]
MDVLTPDETSFSRRALGTALASLGVGAGVGLAAVRSLGFTRLAALVLLAFGAAFAGRTLLSVLVASAPRRPPTADGPLPTVSVLVTAYNEADVLADTVDACRSLDYPDERLEVLVGYESASTDGTAALARSLADDDPLVRAVAREGAPAGKAAATNALLEEATGEVVASLDADQRPAPDALRRAVSWLGVENVQCVKGRCFGTNSDASLVALCATVERAVAERVEFYARDRLGGFTLFTGGQAFFRADALDRLGSFDESVLLEDLDMAYRIARAGGAVSVDPGIVTLEENPTALGAWWHQRKRWARGGMQVARRYLGRGLLSGPPSLPARADFAGTFGALLVLPALALAAPGTVAGLWRWGATAVATPQGSAPALGILVATLLTPILAVYATFALDRRQGYHHDTREYVAPFLLWPYFALQSAAVVAAAVEEFVARAPTVYVTSATGDSEG